MAYVALGYLDDPGDSPVWRYMNFEKLLSVFIDKSLFFASRVALAVNDKYEGQAMPAEIAGFDRDAIREADTKYTMPTIDSFYFNCWHMNDSESDAMWKLYATGSGGVAIRSSITRLKECFHASDKEVHLGRIRYVEDETAHLDHPVHRSMRKRLAFKHEQEVRLIYYDKHREHAGSGGLLIPIDVSTLVEKMVVSPRADDWFLSLVKKTITRLGYDIEVVPSAASSPLPIDAQRL
jgi:hypothetical protein